MRFNWCAFLMFPTDNNRLDLGDLCCHCHMRSIVGSAISGCHQFASSCVGICYFNYSITWYGGHCRWGHICTVVYVRSDIGEYVILMVDKVA